jgi:hypothetical protein
MARSTRGYSLAGSFSPSPISHVVCSRYFSTAPLPSSSSQTPPSCIRFHPRPHPATSWLFFKQANKARPLLPSLSPISSRRSLLVNLNSACRSSAFTHSTRCWSPTRPPPTRPPPIARLSASHPTMITLRIISVDQQVTSSLIHGSRWASGTRSPTIGPKDRPSRRCRLHTPPLLYRRQRCLPSTQTCFSHYACSSFRPSLHKNPPPNHPNTALTGAPCTTRASDQHRYPPPPLHHTSPPGAPARRPLKPQALAPRRHPSSWSVPGNAPRSNQVEFPLENHRHTRTRDTAPPPPPPPQSWEIQWLIAAVLAPAISRSCSSSAHKSAPLQLRGGVLLIQQPRYTLAPLLPIAFHLFANSLPVSRYQLVAAARMAFVVSEGLLGVNCEFCGELLAHAQRTRRFQALQQQLAGDGGAGSLGLVHLSDEWTTSATW